ncbi:MAG: hypothetical protein IKC63_02815 [Clostridia bacterium]|nr:hypothetical protein [Clostridia bacterium]
MRYAMIDIGSNTVKMTIYTADRRLLKKYSQSVYLLSHIQNNRLTASGLDALIAVLFRYRAIAMKEETTVIHAYATASLRGIENLQETVESIRQALGITIDVISGEEEARLSLAGIELVSGIDIENRAVFDLGGGSLEAVLPNGSSLFTQSFPLGALRLFLGFVKNVLPTAEEMREIYRHAQNTVQAASLPAAPKKALAVGGTLRALCRILAERTGTVYDEDLPFTVTREDAVGILSEVARGDRALKLTLIEKIPERIHTLATGLVAFLALIDSLGISEFTVVSGGTREGYLRKITERS